MNIYFINKHSNIKGPFDIADLHQNKIIKIGDVCICETDDGYSFLLVVTKVNKWSACKNVGNAIGKLNLYGNTLLFSFNGISKRCGNKKILNELAILFNKSPLHEFFLNAIDILSYKCDFWNIAIYKEIYILPECVQTNKPLKHPQFNTTTIFESYLPEKAKSLFLELYTKGIQLKDIYSNIKIMYPEDFRHAIKLFLKDYPNSSIYDKP